VKRRRETTRYKSPDADDTYIFKGHFRNDDCAPYINVRVKLLQNNNSFVIPFRIDTGKSVSSFSSKTANEHGINPKTPITLTFGGNKEPPITLPPKYFQITKNPLDSTGTDILLEHPIDTLGTDILFKFFELNLNKNTITLTYINKPYTGNLDQKYMDINVEIPELNINKKLAFGIDTGSSKSSFSREDAKTLGIYNRAQPNSDKICGFEGAFDTKLLEIPMNLRFIKNINQLYIILLKHIIITENNFPTIIGMDILRSHFNLHIKKNIIELTVLASR
jgi:hypothetical protein